MVIELKESLFFKMLSQLPPSKKLLVENEKVFTADELIQGSINLAKQLKRSKVQEGDRVVIALRPGAEFLMLMYANMLVGTIVSIIDPEMGRDNYRAKLQQFKPQHAFVDSRLILLNEHPIIRYLLARLKPTLPLFPKSIGANIFTLGKKLPIFSKHIHLNYRRKTNARINITEDTKDTSDFLITYTSGTLSEPKGVVHTYASLNQTMTLLTNLLYEKGDERIATHLPHFMLLGVNAGREVYLWDNELTPSQKIAFIEKHQITTIFGPPSDFVPTMNYLRNEEAHFPECIKNFYFGSAPVHASFLKKIETVANNARLNCLYGMTENLMVCIQDGSEKINYTGSGDLVGKPFPGVELHIGSDGEVGVDSNQKFKNYWNISDSNKIHWSGDLGKIDEHGNLILIGRKKDMIIRGNFNIYPGLYEPTINKIPGITEAVLIGLYDPKREDEIVYLIIEGEENLKKEDILSLITHGKFSIDKEALPDQVIFKQLERFGRQNKVDRKKMRLQLEKETVW